METLFGLVATVDKEMILHRDLALLDTARTELIKLTLEYRKLNHLELIVDGYNDDPRALYDVPEVNRWMRLAFARWPDLLFWLTPDSLWLVLLCLNPSMHEALPGHRVEVRMNLEALFPQLGESYAAACEVLRKRGLPEDAENNLVGEARENVWKLAKRQKLGNQFGTDYAVVYPKTREVRFFGR